MKKKNIISKDFFFHYMSFYYRHWIQKEIFAIEIFRPDMDFSREF